ncbi:MAG: hypothetical protein DF168_00837 [Candidatus Moanabacter tarae]|uniref:Uncharacterized protein n=1 Tax=Candidatus Moanibacter tarae TaxID=2200854 RepID=A0A2Z4AHD8_9BACT|nr:MAG: hypothetical protein DF168_00837 [Candidatus Moanabacter tarae]
MNTEVVKKEVDLFSFTLNNEVVESSNIHSKSRFSRCRYQLNNLIKCPIINSLFDYE